MTDHQHQYKQIRFGFGDTSESRLIRAEKQQESRKKERANVFNKARNIPESANNATRKKESDIVSVKEDRLTRLQKWKAERERRRKVEKMKEKPPFKVGVVHHTMSIPIINDQVSSNVSSETRKKHAKTIQLSNNSKRITKATEKRLMAKTLAENGEAEPSKKGNTESFKKRKLEPTKKSAHLLANKKRKNENTEESSSVPDDCSSNATSDSFEQLMFGQIRVPMISPDGTNKPALSPRKGVMLNEKTDDRESTLGHNSEESSLFNHSRKNRNSTAADSSIETVSLRLSLPEEDVPISSNNEVAVKNNSMLNESVPKPASSSHNTSGVMRSDFANEPAFFSPYVVSSRGKSSARKEQQMRRGFSLGHSPTDSVPTKDTVMKNLNISVEDEERTAQYFRFLLNKEIDRLTDLCNKWSNVKLESDLSEDAHYLINQAVGQTFLLINKKFERFRSLVSDCETGKGEMLVTCSDLQGFWDMMYMEVKNCDSRFDNLENLRSRNWKEEQQLIKPATKKKVTVKKKVVPAKKSSIKAFLLEKKKLAQKRKSIEIVDGSSTTNEENFNEKFEKSESSVKAKQKSRRSSIRSIDSEDKKSTPAKRKSTRMSLLQTVQLSEANRKVRSPLTIMKISKLCKTPEVHLDDTISYVNSHQTPGKSILKALKEPTESESRAKSTHKVNFDDRVVLNEVPVDEETRTKIDLAKALTRIDSFDFHYPEETVEINAERRLNFDDDSFNESGDPNDSKEKHSDVQNSIDVPIIDKLPVHETLSESIVQSRRKSLRRQNAVLRNDTDIPMINYIPATPCKEESLNTKSRVAEENVEREVSADKEEELQGLDTSIKVLRNRIISSNSTPKISTRSLKGIGATENGLEQKENKTPSRTRKRSLVNAGGNGKGKNNSSVHLDDPFSSDAISEKRRRSTKRNVKSQQE